MNKEKFKTIANKIWPYILLIGGILMITLGVGYRVIFGPSNEDLNAKINNDDNKGSKCLVMQQYVNPLVDFEVSYKDGHKGICKATSVIYGQTDDNIYFLGQFRDTLQILPKILVEDVKEKSSKVLK